MKKPTRRYLALAALAFLAGCNEPKLTQYDMKRAKEFVLSSLPPLPKDPSNRFADNPQAAALGEELFFDIGLSANSAISCAICHQPNKEFQDSIPLGMGIEELRRRTMPLRGIQWGNWFFWDGRKDSQWSQALEPLETPAEHGITRDMAVREVLTRYTADYIAVFGPAPDMTNWPYRASPLIEGAERGEWERTDPAIREDINNAFANIGKALAAYQRTLLPVESRVDRYFDALLKEQEIAEEDRLSAAEIEGFKLFTGKAKCDNCHSGPLYSDQFFHNTGVPVAKPDAPDFGRAEKLALIKADPFSCLGKYSDAKPEECRELQFMSEDGKVFKGAFKTPSLRGVANRAPYMHAGQITTLEAVIDHYVARPDPFAAMPEMDGILTQHGNHNEAPMIELDETEKANLLAFLKAL